MLEFFVIFLQTILRTLNKLILKVSYFSKECQFLKQFMSSCDNGLVKFVGFFMLLELERKFSNAHEALHAVMEVVPT